MRRPIVLLLATFGFVLTSPVAASAADPFSDPVGGFADESSWSGSLSAAATGPVSLQVASGRAALVTRNGLADDVYFDASASGSLRLLHDGSGSPATVQTVEFRSTTATGWTSSTSVSSSPPFRSSPYSWPANAGSGSLTLRSVDANNNGYERLVALNADRALPTVSLPAQGPLAPGAAITATATDDTGVAEVAYRYCPGTTCSWASASALGTATSSPWSVPIPTVADGPITVLAQAKDRATKSSAVASRTITVDSTPPAGGTLSAIAGASPGLQLYDSTRKTLFYNPVATGDVRFQVAPQTPSDVPRVEFPAISETGFTGSGGSEPSPYRSQPYTFTTASASAPAEQSIILRDAAGNGRTEPLSFVRDTDGPAAAVTSSGPVRSGGTLSATATDAEAGTAKVEFGYCQSACAFDQATQIGTDTTAPYSVAWSAPPAEGSYTIVVRATDRVGNTSEAVGAAQVDNTAPTLGALAHTAGSAAGAQRWDSTSRTLTYRPSASPSFSFTPTVSDANGVASVAYPSIAEFAGGSAFSATSAPWRSPIYSAGSSAAPATKNITATDRAGNQRQQSVSFVADSTGPSTTGTSAARVSAGRQVTATATDPVGVVGVEFRYCPATCSFGSATAIGSDSSAPYGVAWTNQPGDGSYSIWMRATDTVGNVSDARQTVAVDNTGPTIDALSATSDVRPDLHFMRGDSTLFFNPSAPGEVKLTGRASDPAGVASATFPSIASSGFAGPGGTVATTGPFSSSAYSFTQGTTAEPGSRNVTLQDSLGNTATHPVSFTIDQAPPANGALTHPVGDLTTGTLDLGVTPATDDGAGMRDSRIERDRAPLTAAGCGAWAGSWSTVANPDATTSAGNCYRYRYVATDNVGNSTTWSGSGVVARRSTVRSAQRRPGSGSGVAGAEDSLADPEPQPRRTAPLRLTRTSATLDRRGRARLPFRCAASTTRGCRGRVAVFAYVRAKRVKRKAITSAKPRRKLVRIGTGHFDARAGKKGSIKVQISRRGRRRIARNRRARCRVSMVVSGRRVNTDVTLRAPRRPRG